MPVERHEVETFGDSVSQGTGVVIEALRKIIPSVKVACGYGLDRVSVAVHLSPSVRLARWLDAGPLRYPRFAVNTREDWVCRLFDIEHDPMLVAIGDSSSRADAITAALDAAEAGSTTEGEQHAG